MIEPDGAGRSPRPARERPWLMRTYAGHSSAQESNALFRRNLAKGQTGLSVAFDLPTQMGYDADHVLARGEVGRGLTIGEEYGGLGESLLTYALVVEQIARGFSQEYEIERLYREVPMLLIGEGTAEIQKMIIGRRLLEEYRTTG